MRQASTSSSRGCRTPSSRASSENTVSNTRTTTERSWRPAFRSTFLPRTGRPGPGPGRSGAAVTWTACVASSTGRSRVCSSTLSTTGSGTQAALDAARHRLTEVPRCRFDAAVVVQGCPCTSHRHRQASRDTGCGTRDDLWVWHLVGLAEADPLHWPIGIQGDSLSVPRYIADLLKSPFPGKSRVGHLRMISLVSRRSLLQERGWVISGLNCDIARRGSGRLLDCTAPVLTVADPCS